MLTEDEEAAIRQIQRDLREEWLAWTDDYLPDDEEHSVSREADGGG